MAVVDDIKILVGMAYNKASEKDVQTALKAGITGLGTINADLKIGLKPVVSLTQDFNNIATDKVQKALHDILDGKWSNGTKQLANRFLGLIGSTGANIYKGEDVIAAEAEAKRVLSSKNTSYINKLLGEDLAKRTNYGLLQAQQALEDRAADTRHLKDYGHFSKLDEATQGLVREYERHTRELLDAIKKIQADRIKAEKEAAEAATKAAKETAKATQKAADAKQRAQDHWDRMVARAHGENIERDKQARKRAESQQLNANTRAAYTAVGYMTLLSRRIVNFVKSGIQGFVSEAAETSKFSEQLGLNPQRVQAWSKAIAMLGGDSGDFMKSIQALNGKLTRLAIMGTDTKNAGIGVKALGKLLAKTGISIRDDKGHLKDGFGLMQEVAKNLHKYTKGEQQGLLKLLGIDKNTQRLLMSNPQQFTKLLETAKKYAFTDSQLKTSREYALEGAETKQAFSKMFASLGEKLLPMYKGVNKLLRNESDRLSKQSTGGWVMTGVNTALTIGTLGIIAGAISKVFTNSIGAAIAAGMAKAQGLSVASASGGLFGLKGIITAAIITAFSWYLQHRIQEANERYAVSEREKMNMISREIANSTAAAAYYNKIAKPVGAKIKQDISVNFGGMNFTSSDAQGAFGQSLNWASDMARGVFGSAGESAASAITGMTN